MALSLEQLQAELEEKRAEEKAAYRECRAARTKHALLEKYVDGLHAAIGALAGKDETSYADALYEKEHQA